MSANPKDNPHEELCRRFRQELKRPFSDRYFSEDDLIDLFDYAEDINDQYIRVETLLLGARLYPDSELLRQRRAIFYSYYDEQAMRSYVIDNPETPGVLWELARVRVNNPSKDEAEKNLAEILDGYEDFEDEEIIQFAEAAQDLGCSDWLVDNLDKLRAKCSYLPTLLYEAAAVAKENGDTRKAIKLLEELTEAEPYVADYWMLLAESQLIEGENEGASTSLDYALAIDPENVDALHLLIKMQPYAADKDLCAQTAFRILKISPSDQLAVSIAGLYLIGKNSMDEFQAILTNALAVEPSNDVLIHQAVQVEHPDLCDILENYYNAGGNNPDNWRDFARTAFVIGDYNAVSRVFNTFRRLSGKELLYSALNMKVAFVDNDYERVTKIFEGIALDEEDDLRHFPYTVMALNLIALLRLKRFDKARRVISDIKLHAQLSPMQDDTQIMGLFAIRVLVQDVERQLENGETDWSAYDPIGFDKLDIPF